MIPNSLKRFQTADLLKGLAVFFMIQVHIMEQFTSHEVYTSYIGKLSLFIGGPFCAPIFLAVMGYFLATSSKPFSHYLKRGLILIFGGILLNIFRSLHLLFHIIGGKFLLQASFFIFGVDILFVAGLSILLIGILKYILKNTFYLYLILALIIAFATPFLPMFGADGSVLQYFNAFLWGNYAWSYFPLFPWFAYVLLGYSFNLFYKEYSTYLNNLNPKYYLSMLVPLIFLALNLSFGINTTYNLQGNAGYYHHGILFFAWAVLFLIVYVVFINLIEKYFSNTIILKYSKWAGRNVTLFYVVQWIIIGNIATIIYKTQSIYQTIYWFLCVLIVTSVVVFLTEKLIQYFKLKNEELI